ncbi:MAG: hypothetical protein MI717_03030 [Spirochaetales bacterium]|nr:hypothetical protein [Spirochaetales bacterium]
MNGRYNGALLALSLSVLCYSCTVSNKIHLAADGSGSLEAQATAYPFTSEAFEDLALMGGFENATQLSEEGLRSTKEGLEAQTAVSQVQLNGYGIGSWDATVQFTNIASLFAGPKDESLVSWEKDSKHSTLTLQFNRRNAHALEQWIPLLQDPTFMLFNPAATGEYAEDEYVRDILGFTFGEENILSIRGSKLTLEVTYPGVLEQVSGGRAITNNTVQFVAPISRVLVPEEGLLWTATWKDQS